MRHRLTFAAVCLCFCGVCAPVLASPQARGPVRPIDAWSDIATDDLHFIRATLRENHPGPADPENPWFRAWYERGFGEALNLARRAQDYAGYYFAIQYFLRGFQDGHLGALSSDPLTDPRLRFKWPGFIVGYQSGRFEVVESEERSLSIGATLVSCDGRPANELAGSVL